MKNRKSVMNHSFSNIPDVKIPRSSFDRSHGYKTTLDSAGVLYPIFLDEALPGDTFNVKMTAFARLATPLKPIMDNMFMETFFFAVPYRLLWDNWQKFNGEQANPGDSTDYTIPMHVLTGGGSVGRGTLFDYMGVPPEIPDISFSALPGRAYNLIWAEWFRDQNLQASPVLSTADAGGNLQDYQLLRRGKRHDYFTSCLPWPQKSEAPVSIPLGDTADVVPTSAGAAVGIKIDGVNRQWITHNVNPNEFEYTGASAGSGHTVQWNAETGLEADLSTATAFTINDIRQAFQTQRMFERDARGGTRYTELIRSHFGVVSPDQRLQRPEYLGGGSSMVNINPVAQTSMSGSDVQTAVTPQGNLAGIGTVGLTGHGFQKSFTEHCLIIGLVSVRADLTYQQGLNRMWSRETRFDFFWPSLAHLGEQAVLNKEIFLDGSLGNSNDDDVFGYQEIYAEYRYKPSLITGKMRSSDPQSLDIWHLSQEFATAPTLSSQFIEDNPPIDRVIAVQDEPHFLFDAYFSMRCARPMPLYGVPGLIDHF